MMVISLPNGILALNLCTETKILQFFVPKWSVVQHFFFTMKTENRFYQVSIFELTIIIIILFKKNKNKTKTKKEKQNKTN